MKISGSGSGYTFKTTILGQLAAGSNAYTNLDEFATKNKPTKELTETIKLTLKAYSDGGYSNLMYSYNRLIAIRWINSADPSYIQDILNNFDDGTLQGWAVANEFNNAPGWLALAVSSTYFLSEPYSLKMTQKGAAGNLPLRARLYKNFTTPNRKTVYAMMNLRQSTNNAAQCALHNLRIKNGDTTLFWLGRPTTTTISDFIPRHKWLRAIVPLPKNSPIKLRIIPEDRDLSGGSYGYLWMDNFKIISK